MFQTGGMMDNIETKNTVKETIKDILYEFVDFGMVINSPTGIIDSCNRQLEEMTGYTANELIGTNLEQLFYGQDEKINFQVRLINRIQGVSESYRTRIQCKDNSVIWVSVRAMPRFDKQDQFMGTISFIENISGYIFQNQVDELIEVLKSEALNYEDNLNGFLALTHELIKKIIPAENMLIALSLTNKTLWFPYICDIFPEKRLKEFRTGGFGLSEYVMKKKNSFILNNQSFRELIVQEGLSCEMPYPDSLIIVPITCDDNTIGIIRCHSYSNSELYNDTSKHLLEKIGNRIGSIIEKIRNNSERKMFFELSNIPIVTINKDGFFEFVNSSFLTKMGYDMDELIHQPVETFIHPEDRYLFRNSTERLVKGEALNDFELRMIRSDNEIICFSWFAQQQVAGISYYFVGRDITVQKEELKTNERLNNRLRNLVRHMKEGVLFVDFHGRIVHANRGLCEMLGYEKTELLGEYAIELLHPSYLHSEIKRLFEIRRSGVNDRYETEYLNKKGESVRVNLSLTAEFDRNGQFMGVMAIVTDISEEFNKKQKKERLFRLHKSFFTLNKAITRGYNLQQIQKTVLSILKSTYQINVSRIYMVRSDSKSDQFSLTLETENLMTKSTNKLSTIFPNGISSLVPNVSLQSPYYGVIKQQQAFFLQGKEDITEAFAGLKSDPALDAYKAILNYMKIECYALFPILHDSDTHCLIECVSEHKMNEGEVDDLIAFMQQVNAIFANKLGDIDLKKNEEKWRGLIENSSEITCVLNELGEVIFASPSVYRMLGFASSEVLNTSIFDFIHPEDRQGAHEKFLVRLEEGGLGFYQILRIVNSEGAYRFFRVFLSNQLDKEEIGGLIVNAQDITEMILAENEKYLSIIETEENERKRISRDLHDGVGQYLAATNMYMNLLEMQIEDQLSDESKVIFKRTVDILEKATTEVRAVSHNIMPPSLKDFGLMACVKGLVDGLNQCSGQIKFIIVHDVKLEGMPEWMGLTLFRAIQQILNNAITHGKPSEINIKMVTNQSTLTIEIADNGIGFDPRMMDEHDGIGIMSIRHRIQSVGGQTIIESEPGNGTKFTIISSLNYSLS